MKTKFSVLFILLITSSITIEAQGLLEDKNIFTRQDTLRGTITPERIWWDVTHYQLEVKVDPDNKYISGTNTIQYEVLKSHNVMQIDLQTPLNLTKATQFGEELQIKHDGNAHFITLKASQKVGVTNSIKLYYEGYPKEAVRAPWDGGFSWKKDENNKHFVATSCQGLGASVWWPNKDHMYDEVNSMDMYVTIPKGLMNVSNGRLKSIVENNDNTITTHWYVVNPINNYGVNINIGDYVHFSEVFKGEKGDLDMDYYVLRDNLEKAKEHFKDAPKMMKAFEHWFGPYPFYEDGFKLVEVPYLGMEHQSSITYGNKYKKGYLGNDLSKTGWGLKFDFIIIHEAGHEWFANNITYKDIADMWIHEGFTAYSEGLYLEYHYNKQAGDEYTVGKGKDINNDRPIIGYYNVNKGGSGDMYNKGAYMLHTLRQLIDNDEKWRMILRGLNKTFYHQTVTTKQVEDFLSKETGIDLTKFFNQYLRDVRIPTLEYEIKNDVLKFRYTNIVENFYMPIKIHINGSEKWLFPKAEWQTMSTKADDIKIDDNFLVYYKKV